MKVSSAKVLAALSALLLSGAAHAFGGFGVSVTLPKPGDAQTKDAVLIVQPIGCHGPGSSVTARAEGFVQGKRRSVKLTLVPVQGQDDTYMLKRAWTNKGTWVIVLSAKKNTLHTDSLVQIGRDGKPVVKNRPVGNSWDAATVLPDRKTKLLPWTYTNDEKVVALNLVAGNLDTAVAYMLRRPSPRH